MGRHERSIKIAFDKISGEILEADGILDSKKDAFQVRREFHRDEVALYCCECQQKLLVSSSKYDRLHFKHSVHADYCILKDGNLTPEQLDSFSRILKAKESDRHKELKNKIAQRLSKVDGIDTDSIAIDNKFIIKGKEKRRPDVYCKYFDKEIVFEIQLSDLSLRYILSRYDFYKENGIYLIWILDKFDVHGQSQMVKDIKYLTKFENFFKLDETANDFKLYCQYKFPFLTDDNKLLTKWLNKCVSLADVKFDSQSFQIFYYNFGDNKTQREQERQNKEIEIRNTERKKQQEEQLAKARLKVKELIKEIKRLKTNKIQEYKSASQLINDLDDYEIDILNEELKLNKRDGSKKPALLQWISEAAQHDIMFIEFILKNETIYLDVNKKDEQGITAFQEIFINKNISKNILVKSLFRRGYKLTGDDLKYLPIDNKESTADKLIYEICDRLKDRWLTDKVFEHSKLIFIIESVKRDKILGFKFKENEWVAFANSAIHNHKEHWDYIELSFKYYGFWDKLITSDKNGTFQKKIQDFYSNIPRQRYDFDRVFKDLYPEVEMRLTSLLATLTMAAFPFFPFFTCSV
jgi:competence CoiA-like predicted nuclease